MGPKPNFIRPLGQGFPAEFEYITRYKQMVHGLFSLQFSRFSFALGGFCQNAEKITISIFFPLQQSIILMISLRPSPISFVHCQGFPAEFEYIIIFKQMVYGLFSLQFSWFSFALDGFCQNAEKNAISIFFPLQQSIIFMISLRPSSISFVHYQDFLRNSSILLHRYRW